MLDYVCDTADMEQRCPHCNKNISDDELKSLWASRSSSMRENPSGGRNGGRPSGSKDRKPRVRRRKAAAR
jgi:hypothetical protein